MIVQLTPFGKGSGIAVRFNFLLIFMVSWQIFFPCQLFLLVSRLLISLSKSFVETGHFQGGVKLPLGASLTP